MLDKSDQRIEEKMKDILSFQVGLITAEEALGPKLHYYTFLYEDIQHQNINSTSMNHFQHGWNLLSILHVAGS